MTTRDVLQALVVVASVAALMGVIEAIRRLGAARSWSPELRRKCVHVATGLFATALPLLFRERWPVLFLCALSVAAMLWMRLPGQRHTGLGSTLHSVERKSWGDVFLALSIGFLFVQARGNPILFCLPMAVVTLSDSAAALAGSAYGQRIFHVQGGSKSWEGVAVFFVVTWLVAMTMLLLMTDVPRLDVVLLSLSVGAFGALVEAHSWRGLDNVFVPVGVFLYLHANLAEGPVVLAVTALVFLAATAAFTYGSRTFGMTPHAARVNGIVVFGIASYAGAVVAIPVVALVCAHVLARTERPCRSAYPDLDVAAAVVGAACAWLFLEAVLGPAGGRLFGLSCLAGTVVYAALATDAGSRATVALVPCCVVAYLDLSALAGPGEGWTGDAWWAALASSFCALVSYGARDWFDRWRAPRVLAVASAVPLIAYLARASYA